MKGGFSILERAGLRESLDPRRRASRLPHPINSAPRIIPPSITNPVQSPILFDATGKQVTGPKITQVDPNQLLFDTSGKPVDTTPTIRTVNREAARLKSAKILGAAGLVALVVTLFPKIALAGPIAALASTPLGMAVLVGAGLIGLTFYIKYMYGFDKTMNERNNNPGDPTLRKQLTNFAIVPGIILTGTGLLYLGATLLPIGATPVFFGLAAVGLGIGIYKFIQSVRKSTQAASQTITPGYKATKRQIAETNLFSHVVQGAEAAYIFYRGATLAELMVGVCAAAGGSIIAGGLAPLAIGAVVLGIPIFLLTSHYLSVTSRKWNETQHEFGPRVNFKKLAFVLAGSALAGALLFTFAPLIINIVLGLAFFVVETHALVHNWSCQGGSREIIQSPPEEYSGTQVWKAGRRPTSPWITVMKPGFDPADFLTPSYAMLYLRKGANWDFNIISGINLGMLGNFKDTHESLQFLRDKQQAVLDIISAYRSKIDAPGVSTRDKYVLLAQLNEELAAHWKHAATGDFSALTVTKKLGGKSNVFSKPDAEEFEKYLGEAILWEAQKFTAMADELRRRTMKTDTEVDEHLQALERQFGLIFHWFPPKQFRNICPDVIKSKIREIDLFNQMCRNYKTGASVLRRNRKTGEYYWEILPCQRYWKLDTHTNTLNWTTPTNDRTDAEMRRIESHSDLRYGDNRNMRNPSDPSGRQHTRQAYTYDTMRGEESFTVEHRNGCRETFHASGTKTVVGTRDPNVDEVVWVPGMANPPADLIIKNEDYFDKSGNIHDVFRPALFHFFGSKYQTMCDGEHADINTSDFLAALEKDIQDPYLFSLWRVPEEIDVPWDRGLMENEATDRLVRISASYANFMLRVVEKDGGKTLYIPYNWMKNTQLAAEVWTDVHSIELLTRDDFKAKFGADARDSHGDKYPYVIVAYDRNGRRLIPKVNTEGKQFKGIGLNEKDIIKCLMKDGFIDKDGVIQPKFIPDKSKFVLSMPATPKQIEEIFNRLLNLYVFALPYSSFLKDPSAYECAEFDRGLGRIGDMNFVAYTFERADGSRYMRWLPREEDWPELDFDRGQEKLCDKDGNEIKDFSKYKGEKIYLHTCRWIGKRFAYDRHRLVLDAGTHADPNFEVTAIEGPEQFLQSIGVKNGNRFVVARYCRKANGTMDVINYEPFTGSTGRLDHVVDQRRDGQNLFLTRITPADKRVVELGCDETLPDDKPLRHPSTWVKSVTIDKSKSTRQKVCVTVTFENPYNNAAAGTQDILVDRKKLPDNLDDIYLEGNNPAFLPTIFDQRQRNKKTKKVENRLFLVFHTCKTKRVEHKIKDLYAEEDVRLIEVKSSLKIRKVKGVSRINHREVDQYPNGELWVPFDQAMPRASQCQIWFDPDHKPFSSGLSFGHVDTMIAPQHLVPIRRNPKPGLVSDTVGAAFWDIGQVGPEWATDDQKFYFGEIYDGTGEYNWPHGWIRGERRALLWSTGLFSLQYAKSVRGAALNTGSNTVMRSPHEDMLFCREELDIYTENGMPAPLEKSLFDKATTTEDAQGAWEKKRMFDLDTRMDRTVRSIGSSVNNLGEGMGQRGRWAAMLQFLQRVPKIFYDELIRARLLHRIPPQYTNEQLHEWFNTFTWYLDTVFKHVIPVIPFTYMLGFSPLPAGAIVFPLLWAIKTFSGWPKYSLDNQKMGVARIRSYFRNLALYYLYVPNVSRNTVHINDEAKGPFISTAGIGGKTFFPWALRRIVYYFGGLSGITFGMGLYKLLAFGTIAFGSTTSAVAFGLVMNIIWPGLLFLSVLYATRMVWNEMKRINPSKPRLTLFTDEFAKPLTVEFFKELMKAFKNAQAYYRYGEL